MTGSGPANSLDGTRVDRYLFGPLLAEGGMGRVYRAVDLDLDRTVAIKVPRANSAVLRQRFEREISISVRLAHPGVVPIHGTGKLEDDTPYYVMRFVDGDSLEAVLARITSASDRLELATTLLNVADTMAYVHSEAIVHRDLKPSNILVGRFGEVVIIDWGLAKELVPHMRPSFESMDLPPIPAQDIAAERDLTHAGDVFGTPAFMSPEQARGEAVDRRTDVYALGAILWHVLMGRLPSPEAVARDISADEISPSMVEICRRAMAANRAERFTDAGAFARALRDVLRPHANAEHVVAIRRRSRIAVSIIASIAGVTLLALTWRTLREHRAPQARAAVTMLDVGLAGNTVVALSPSGNRIVYASQDRLRVRDRTSGSEWALSTSVNWPAHIQFQNEDVLEYPDRLQPRLALWNVATGQVSQAPVDGPQLWTRWLGQLEHHQAFATIAPTPDLVLFDGANATHIALRHNTMIETGAISPSGKRFAFVDAGKFEGVIRVIGDEGGEQAASPVMSPATALSWVDEQTLIYAINQPNGQGSIVFTARASAEGLQHPTQVYRYDAPKQWIGGLATASGIIIATVAKTMFQTTLVERASQSMQTNLDTNTVSAPLSWRDDQSFWAWNGGTGHVELDHIDGSVSTISSIHFTAEPANATRAGDELIVSLRADRGRRIEAYSLIDGALKWTIEPGAVVFVRCAGDSEPPCIAGKQVSGSDLELHRIDIQSGVVGERLLAAEPIEDAAVSPDGHSIAIVNLLGPLRAQTDLNGDATLSHLVRINSGFTSHTIAFSSNDDGIIIDRPGSERILASVHIDGTVDSISRSSANVLSLARPSPRGDRLLYRARSFTVDIAQLSLEGATATPSPKR